MTVVWTEDRIPKFVLETGGYPDSVRWRLDFDTRDAREAWKRSLTSRPGAKRFLRSSAGRVDLILYPQFRFRNSRLDVMYEVQINLNPTLEVNLWRGSKLTAQLIVPILNEFYKEESRVRPGYLTLSQRFRLPANVLAKATFGNFSMNRWGADLKLFKPVGRHFGIYAEARADGDFVSLLRRLVVCPDEQMDLDGGRKLLVEPVRSDVRCKCGPVFGGRHRCDGQGNPIFSQSRRRILCAEDAEGRLQRRILFRSGASSVQDQAPPACAGRAVEVFRDGVQCQSLSALRPELRNLADDNCAENFFNATRYNQIINNYTNH